MAWGGPIHLARFRRFSAQTPTLCKAFTPFWIARVELRRSNDLQHLVNLANRHRSARFRVANLIDSRAL